MNITKKIIVTDTNIITDLHNAKILEKFVELDNVYISDLIKHDEITSHTGDNKLKIYSEENGIEVIRTLKIIGLMTNSNIITHSEAIEACQLLKSCSKTRIPVCAIDDFIEKLEKDSVLI